MQKKAFTRSGPDTNERVQENPDQACRANKGMDLAWPLFAIS